jgi:hypothetical protein
MRNYLKIPDLAPKWMQLPTLKQLTNDMDENRMSEIEIEPINLVLSYLTNTYEIEKELELGRSIEEQDTWKEYRPGALFYKDGKFYRAAHLIKPEVRFEAEKYWIPVNALPYDAKEYFGTPPVEEPESEPEIPGDGEPGLFSLVEPEPEPEPEVPVEPTPVVPIYELPAGFYRIIEGSLYRLDAAYNGEAPQTDSGLWEPIYTEQYSGEANYLASEYVEHDGLFYACAVNHGIISNTVTHPAYVIVDQKADTLESAPEKFDQIPDPRNGNIVRHLALLATFFMYQANVPDRIPLTITDQEEATCKWLSSCAKMQINPLLPRKNVRDTTKKVGRAVVVASQGDAKNWRY